MADMLYNSESQIPANATAAGWTLVQQSTPVTTNYFVPLMVLAVVAVLVFMAMRRR
jgi:hypothetical protein